MISTQEKLDKQQQHLEHKKSELDAILKETEKEEKALVSKSEEFSKTIDQTFAKCLQKNP